MVLYQVLLKAILGMAYLPPVADPIKMNSTGTSMQRIDGKVYVFMGGLGELRCHSYPDLS